MTTKLHILTYRDIDDPKGLTLPPRVHTAWSGPPGPSDVAWALFAVPYRYCQPYQTYSTDKLLTDGILESVGPERVGFGTWELTTMKVTDLWNTKN